MTVPSHEVIKAIDCYVAEVNGVLPVVPSY